MHVKNIWIENAVLQASEGIDIQEASNINLKNINIITKNSDPLVYVLNSDKIKLDNIKYKDSADVLLQVQGDRSKEIAFIKKAIDENKILLGVCLGAQFIGEALGAKFVPSPRARLNRRAKRQINWASSVPTVPTRSCSPTPTCARWPSTSAKMTAMRVADMAGV